MNSPVQQTFAAVDLGSNSFHMIVANYNDQRLQVIDKLKDMVRLASGLDEDNKLSGDIMERAITCLEKFGQRLRDIPRLNVRAVGTNTLRKARNSKDFLRHAQQALGQPIDIISGQEEARLVFLGVTHSIYNQNDKCLVIDIGGGSTEVIIGRGFEPIYMESLYMGCANITQRFFNDGTINRKKMNRAILFARQELESISTRYKKLGWQRAIGSSGTNISIHEIIKQQGWSDDGISQDALQKLNDALINIGDISQFNFDGLSEQRRPIFIGGVAILCALFEALEIEKMQISDGALREGLLHDLIGRAQDQDIRDKTIQDFMQRYTVDTEHARNVSTTATTLFAKLQKAWGLNKTQDLKLLQRAAQVHEIGVSIAHAQHHRHSAYLLSNSDMPGFSTQEQSDLAILVRVHRRKFPIDEVKKLNMDDTIRIQRLCIILRLAVLLNRSRLYTALPDIKIHAVDDVLNMNFPKDWLNNHPLTVADLETETDYLKVIGVNLRYQ